jgi:hypothetical protein
MSISPPDFDLIPALDAELTRSEIAPTAARRALPLVSEAEEAAR